MATIILGIVGAIIIAAILIAFDASPNTTASIFIVIVFLSILAGIFYPFSGYNDWKLIKETELTSLSNSSISGGTGFTYVSLSADNSYTYRFAVDSEFGTKTSKEYRTATIVNDDNVTEVEDPNCQQPVLLEYKRTAKKSIWTFGVSSETNYVFYVPEGTISKDIKLE